ncbi:MULTISPECIES: nitrogen regulation protein NR(II) [Methylomonas]|uniref:Sensory histidine kinase/phosphatase NtrB n=2 Tax=Methylomonas TaxID=416 RepID=A0A126T7J0_9GAMM|nr:MULTISPECIES: nitrogen regulation protein NR(II) [Methylomonas]AMK78041.1 PAS domain-containing sensor histidine kinase [Methylomonas denitrificans]OAI07661.1 PAS domain-containing sensor histidine kinase [Methylomonas methanica]TCV85576.1 two-component system nitrogen regulation sensor histidine kinase GlnL [Methylomonas methanica]
MHKKILDHLNEAILLFDKDLRLTYINPAGEMLLADSAKHLLGQSAHKLFKTAHNTLFNDLLPRLYLLEPLVDRELILERLSQSITVNLSATPLLEDGKLSEILIELQQVDRHLRITKEEQLLAQQNTSRMLVRGLAHEIKNPLGGLRGAAQLLDLELQDPELKEYTQIIIAESDRLQDLMDKMLGPNKPAHKSQLNIHEVLERVRHLVTVEAAHGIMLHTNYDPSIPEIFADKNQLIQAILNIVRNAVQAVQNHGVITIKTRVQRHMTIGRKRYKLTVKIDIIDNGPGIKPELMGQIFYPMITGRAEGTGLGLSIAQSLINQHNGLIECESEPGNTVFSIYLPLETNHANT